MALILRQSKGDRLSIAEADGNFTYLESLVQQGGVGPQGPEGSGGGGGGLAGTRYIFVAADGTPTENALELQAAYDEVKTWSPASDNRIVVIAAPGEYAFNGTFTMDTQYIDLVSLTGGRDVIIYQETTEFSPAANSHNIVVEEGNILVRGVDASTEVWVDAGRGVATRSGRFHIADDLTTLVCDNCQGGDASFGGNNTGPIDAITVSGTFTDCVGGPRSFGGGINSIASGTFTDCVGGDGSFGGLGGNVASGTFTNCVGGDASFGGGGGTVVSGTFTNCVGGDTSFGGTLSGRLYYCRLTSGLFPTVSVGGVTVLCIDGNNSINTQN